MTIDWQIIPHSQQRYPTVGDWWTEGDLWHFRVSNLGSFKYEALVFVHELVEMLLCFFKGIPAAAIDAFDQDYEAARGRGLEQAPCGCLLHDEPGDDPHSPYYWQHQAATLCEFTAAKFMGVNWKDYCKRCDEL